MSELPLGGTPEYSTTPRVAWQAVCRDKKRGGLSIKDLYAWNKALIAKLVWVIAMKKDVLWVRWVHGHYLKNKNWWDYTSNPDSSWYWKKIYFIKEFFKEPRTTSQWTLKHNLQYKVKLGYQWQLGDPPKEPWAKLVWNRSNIPRHAFITWIYSHHWLPTKARLSKFHQ